MTARPTTISGTKRQTVTAADGTSMQRQYVYLPSHVWFALGELARTNGMSVSQTIQSFALAGNANSKESNVRTTANAR